MLGAWKRILSPRTVGSSFGLHPCRTWHRILSYRIIKELGIIKLTAYRGKAVTKISRYKLDGTKGTPPLHPSEGMSNTISCLMSRSGVSVSCRCIEVPFSPPFLQIAEAFVSPTKGMRKDLYICILYNVYMVYTKRKIVKFGSSSHIVSLPAKWIKKYGLGKESYLEVEELSDGGLVLWPEFEEKPKKIVIKHKTFYDIEPQVISAYLNGFTEIKIVSDSELSKKNLEKLRAMPRRLSGMETINEGRNFMEYTAYTEMGGIELMRETRRMELVLSGMFDDVVGILQGMADSGKLSEKEDILDRFYFLTCRQIRSLLSSPSEGMSNLGLLSHYSVTRAMERIGDHLLSMGKYARKVSGKSNEQVISYVNETKEIFNSAFSSFVGDGERLFETIEKGDAVRSKGFPLSPKGAEAIPLVRILYNLRRICDHSVDIAEAKLNNIVA